MESKKVYKVHVRRVEEQIVQVSVEATSPTKAKQLAVKYAKCQDQHVYGIIRQEVSYDSKIVQTWD
ncbi:MAG: hypothetical protein WC525_07545 [Candidatus Thermoplasmatota archaeon]